MRNLIRERKIKLLSLGLAIFIILALCSLDVLYYPYVETQAQYSGPGTAPLVFDHLEHGVTRMYDPSTNVVCYLFPGDSEHDKVCLILP